MLSISFRLLFYTHLLLLVVVAKPCPPSLPACRRLSCCCPVCPDFGLPATLHCTLKRLWYVRVINDGMYIVWLVNNKRHASAFKLNEVELPLRMYMAELINNPVLTPAPSKNYWENILGFSTMSMYVYLSKGKSLVHRTYSLLMKKNFFLNEY